MLNKKKIVVTILVFLLSLTIYNALAITIYDYEHFLTLNGWTIHADLNPTLDYSNYKTESSSMALMETDYETYDRNAYWDGVTIDENSGTEVLGFWMWCNSTRTYDNRDLFRVQIDDSGQWHCLYVFWDGSKFAMGQGYTGAGIAVPVEFHMNRWYWVQMWQQDGTDPRTDVWDNVTGTRVYSHRKAGASYPIDNGTIRVIVANQMKISHLTTEYALFDYFRIADEEEYPPTLPPEQLGQDIEIENMEGCGDWVFAEERFYYFNMSLSSSTNYTVFDQSYLNFTDDGQNLIVAYWDFSQNRSYLTEGKDIVGIRTGEFSYNSTDDNSSSWVIIELFFTEEIIDSANIDIYMWSNDTLGYNTTWQLVKPNYFWIYSDGGLTSLTTGGTANRFTGGQTFDMYAGAIDTNQSDWIKQEIHFRDLQAVHGLYALNAYDDGTSLYDGSYDNLGINGYYEFGMDYCPQSTGNWVEGWKAYLQVDSWTQSGSGTNNLTYQVIWYSKMNESTWQYVKTDYIGSFWEDNDGKYDDQSRIYVDLWYGQEDFSSIGEGRVSAYYKSWEGGFWFWEGGHVIATNYLSTFATTLYDDNNNTVYYEQIKMMRFWVKIYKFLYLPILNDNTYKERWEINHVEGLNYHTTKTIEGTDEPIWVEPKDPEVYSWGFLEPLRQAVLSIGTSIVNGLLTVVGTIGMAVVGGLDWMLEQIFHTPYLFTNFIFSVGQFIGQIGTYVLWIGQFFVGGITFIWNMIVPIGMFIFAIFTWFGDIAVIIVGSISGTMTFVVELWEGTGMFSSMGFGVGEIFNVMMIAFFAYLVAGMVTFGFDWLWQWVDKGIMIINFVAEILLMGYHMLKGLIDTIGGLLPFT